MSPGSWSRTGSGSSSRRPGRTDRLLQAHRRPVRENLLAIFDVLIDLHRDLAEAGWVASDLYDGCLIVDFSTSTLHVVDLDNYRSGPSVNDMGRMFGAKRFMAPEEFHLAATIDQRTTVSTWADLSGISAPDSASRPTSSVARTTSQPWSDKRPTPILLSVIETWPPSGPRGCHAATAPLHSTGDVS